MTAAEIKNMTRVERLQAMELLWDALLAEDPEIESPDWHKDVLAERKRLIESGKAEFISLEELKATRKS